jgi:putative oxidoreductase
MKILLLIVRLLMGLLLLFSSVVVLFKLVPMPELKGDVKVFMDGMNAAVYLLPLVKITELVCAIALLSNRFVALATVVIFPILLNVLLYHFFLDPAGHAIAIALFAGNLFLAYSYRKNYQMLFISK